MHGSEMLETPLHLKTRNHTTMQCWSVLILCFHICCCVATVCFTDEVAVCLRWWLQHWVGKHQSQKGFGFLQGSQHPLNITSANWCPQHDAELHACLGNSGAHIAPSPKTVHFALQPRGRKRRDAVEGETSGKPVHDQIDSENQTQAGQGKMPTSHVGLHHHSWGETGDLITLLPRLGAHSCSGTARRACDCQTL